MKRGFNVFIFLVFFFLFLFQDSFVSLMKEPEVLIDEDLRRELQNIKEEYQKVSEVYEIELPFEKKMYSRVLYRDPLEFFDMITIQKGSSEGVENNAAVLNEDGLIGIVSATTEHTSKVRLLTNRETSLSVKIGNAYGILKANNLRELWVTNISSSAEIKIGDKVFTSGLTEIPQNILIGEVLEIRKDELGLIQDILINKVVEEEEIDYVIITMRSDL